MGYAKLLPNLAQVSKRKDSDALLRNGRNRSGSRRRRACSCAFLLQRTMAEKEDSSSNQAGDYQERQHNFMPWHSSFGPCTWCGRHGRRYSFELCRWVGITDDIGIEIHHGDNNTVFHFEIAQLVQIRLPTAVLREIVRHAFANENVTGITAIHYALRDVDAGAGDILTLVHIRHVMHRPAVNAHPHGQTRLCTQPLTDLKRTFHRL